MIRPFFFFLFNVLRGFFVLSLFLEISSFFFLARRYTSTSEVFFTRIVFMFALLI